VTTALIQPGDLIVGDSDQVAYATAWIRAYCGWVVAPAETITRTLDASAGRLLLLPTMHLTAVGDVVVHVRDRAPLPVTTDVTLDPALLTFSASGSLRRSDADWPDELSAVTVTFTHGYATVPDDLKAVAVAIARRLPAQLASVTAEAAGGVSRQYGGLLSGQASLSASFTAVEQMVLDRYRIPFRP
jgi:hypothetical protein